MPSFEFFLTALVAVLIPGTGVLYTVSTALLLGRRASVAAACGCTTGILPHLLASIMGFAAIFHIGALAFQLLKYAGAAYLLYLAWSMWRATGMFGFDRKPAGNETFGRIILRGFLLNIFNPKLSVFFLAFLPQFIAVDTQYPVAQMVLLSGIFMGMTLGIFILYGVFAHGMRAYMFNSLALTRRMQRSFAAVFAVLGIKLALTEQ